MSESVGIMELRANKTMALNELAHRDSRQEMVKYANLVIQSKTGRVSNATKMKEIMAQIRDLPEDIREEIRGEILAFSEQMENASKDAKKGVTNGAKRVTSDVVKTIARGAATGVGVVSTVGTVAPGIFDNINSYLEKVSPELAAGLGQVAANVLLPGAAGPALLAGAGIGAAIYCGGKALWNKLEKIARNRIEKRVNKQRLKEAGEIAAGMDDAVEPDEIGM